MSPSEVVQRLVERLRQAPKYAGLCDDLLVWAVQQGLREQRSEKLALKVAKRKLHQAFGSFLPSARRKELLSVLAAAAGATDPQAHTALLRQALSLHASTAERLESGGLEDLWSVILDHVGTVRSVLDLGCGLAPAVLPWTQLPVDVRYLGVDLDGPLCEALQAALRPRWPHVRIEARDVRGEAPWPEVDVVLMAKLLPTVERQASGSAVQLVERLRARWLVATFPLRSLGGRDRGMGQQYRGLATRVLGPGTTLEVAGELVHLVERRDESRSA
ncbi:MAG: hypothetical protein KTR31_26165 [Myxococcales bacterium]|nr:hypothetical protein [Myxococcales bacterium]